MLSIELSWLGYKKPCDVTSLPFSNTDFDIIFSMFYYFLLFDLLKVPLATLSKQVPGANYFISRLGENFSNVLKSGNIKGTGDNPLQLCTKLKYILFWGYPVIKFFYQW